MKTIDPIEFITMNAGKLTTAEIAKELGKTPNSVLCIAKRRGISLAVEDLSYTDEEDEFIIEHVDEHSFEDLAILMSRKFKKRSKDSVRQRSATLNLSGEDYQKPPVKSVLLVTRSGQKWTAIDDVQIVLIRHGKTSYEEVAKKLGKTVESVRFHFKKLEPTTPEYQAAEVLAKKLYKL